MLNIHMKQNINFYLTKEKVDLKHCNDSKAFIEYSNNMNIYKNTGDYNPKKTPKNNDCF